MADDEIRYDRMVEDALRTVVNRVLTHIAERGLPGDHHFYITFLTGHPGVVMPDHLRARYPSEMTIVLQYQFWGLEVGTDAFSVTLSFANVPERLTVPYEAVTAFADPSVRFGLQFDVTAGERDASGVARREEDPLMMGEAAPPEVEVANLKVSGEAKPSAQMAEAIGDGSDTDTAKVVTLDAFRKVDDGRKK